MRNVENFFAHFVPRMFLTSFNFFVIAIFEISPTPSWIGGEYTSAEARKSSLFYLELDKDMFSLAF